MPSLMKTSKTVRQAVALLAATQLAASTWAHFASETSRWYVVSAAELADLGEYLDHPDESIRDDAYSHWCAGTPGTEMPAGWSPEVA